MDVSYSWSDVFDAHCHPQDDFENIESIGQLKTSRLCVMGTRMEDLDVVAKLAADFPHKVIPSFGFHPWFAHILSLDSKTSDAPEHYRLILQDQSSKNRSHDDIEALILSLPTPISIKHWLPKLESLIRNHPTALIGEIGLDRSARLLNPETKSISKVQTTLKHQLAVLEAQLGVAAKYQRAVSLHCVQATGPISELFQSKIKQGAPLPPRVCMHSFGGSVETIRNLTRKQNKEKKKQQSEVEFYFSFSIVINERYEKLPDLIRAVPDDRLLIETDVNTPNGLDSLMQRIIVLVSNAKGWREVETVAKIKQNFQRFIGLQID